MGLDDMIALGVAAGAVAYVAWRMWRTLRGRGGCGCGAGSCHARPGATGGASTSSATGVRVRLNVPGSEKEIGKSVRKVLGIRRESS